MNKTEPHWLSLEFFEPISIYNVYRIAPIFACCVTRSASHGLAMGRSNKTKGAKGRRP